MRLDKYPTILIACVVILSMPVSAETGLFLSAETVQIDTELEYANGSEDYEFTGERFKIGWDFPEGAVVGVELLSGDSDQIIDPFGTPFELKTDTAVGIFFHMGRPFYLRLGWSIWDTEYTDLVSNITDKEEVSAIEYGLGFRLPIGSNITAYADYSKRNSDPKYPAHITGSGRTEYDSELVSLGLSLAF